MANNDIVRNEKSKYWKLKVRLDLRAYLEESARLPHGFPLDLRADALAFILHGTLSWLGKYFSNLLVSNVGRHGGVKCSSPESGDTGISYPYDILIFVIGVSKYMLTL